MRYNPSASELLFGYSADADELAQCRRNHAKSCEHAPQHNAIFATTRSVDTIHSPYYSFMDSFVPNST